MVLWTECLDCKGSAGHYEFHGKGATWSQKWVPCEPCDGKGAVPMIPNDNWNKYERLAGPVDDIEEECTRG